MKRAPVTAGPGLETLERHHPALLVLDVDEVVLHFIQPFRQILAEHGAALHADSFRLTGNVRSLSTGAALTGHELDGVTEQLYAEQERRQKPVAGVAEALRRLGSRADILFLTAMTPAHYDARRRLLDRELLPYPMIATERAKGAVIAELAALGRSPILFADDLPPNLAGVRKSASDVILLHLMADDAFRPHLPPLPDGAHSALDWAEAEPLIGRLFDERR